MPTRTIHLITDDCYPSPGGMQASVLRIARLISSPPETSAEICVLSLPTAPVALTPHTDITTHSLAAEWLLAAQPLLDSSTGRPSPSSNREEITRLTFLALRNHIQRRLDMSPANIHLILSFYLTDVGFAAQQVASTLGLPHITTLRGSDYSRGFFCPDTIGAVEYVLRRADHIVATNNQQRESIQKFFGITDKISVIYNSQKQLLPAWRRTEVSCVQLFSDSGYAHKKGTHILLDAFKRLKEEGFPLRLCIVGRTKLSEQAFWDSRRAELERSYSNDVSFLGYKSVAEIIAFLGKADIFCSATLGEGCSQARTRALLTGMPIVTTACGEMADLATDTPGCYTAPAGDSDGYTAALRAACTAVMAGEVMPSPAARSQLADLFSEKRESSLWNQVLRAVTKRRFTRNSPPRILLYTHEGKGLGHLRRVANVANVLQDTFSTLIVSGHRELGWLPKVDCEFVHIPSLEGIDRSYLSYNRRRPFIPGPTHRPLAIRRAILEATVKAFEPDAIILDYLPFGNGNEMLEVLKSSKCLKYLILRGVVDDKQEAVKEVFFDTGAIVDVFDKVFVACDPAIIDLQAEYDLGPDLGEKLLYTGYVCMPSMPENRRRLRQSKGLQDNQRWVVCSSGGGKRSDSFLTACVEVARHFPDVRFDIVAGPRFRPSGYAEDVISLPPNAFLVRETAELPLWHSACDVVLSHGGYNSMIETISAGVPLLVFPSRGEVERMSHARRLEKFGVVEVVERASEIPFRLNYLLTATPHARTPPLAMNGAEVIADYISTDLERRPNIQGGEDV